ncbi:unnamed protein product [Durusdinium trenchii]|uniref:Uncharacterized protein n=1 Tax=Durusdinium trenchii TaxID=1381693 RepID=A0ABP0SX78_9DINO
MKQCLEFGSCASSFQATSASRSTANCGRGALTFDSFNSYQQQHGWQQQPSPNQQQHGWQQHPPSNQQQNGWQQHPPPNQQQNGWQQHPPPNQQQNGWQQHPPPNQQQNGWQQHPPPNQQQHGWQQQGGSHQQPVPTQNSNPTNQNQEDTHVKHHDKESPSEPTIDKDNDSNQDEDAENEADPVPEPKVPEASKKKLEEEKVMETKKVQKEEAEEREKAAKKEDEANEREEIEEKAKEMLKSLPPLPEDDQANHRSWESQLSSKDVKHQMEASREMDKLRDKQHAGAFFVQGRRPASGFLHFADPQAPPGHFSSESARASATEEEDHANHRSWEAKLTAEDLKSQMTASRERDSLRGKPLAEAGGNEGADEGAGGASGGASSEGSGGIRGKRGEGRGAAKRSADLTGDEDEGEMKDKTEVEVTKEPGGAEAASRVVLLPVVRQIGESVGLHSSLQNHITTFDLALKHSRAPKFFCGREGAPTHELQPDDHPAIYFRFPVKNVNVELTNLGKNGQGEKEVIWSATYSSDTPITGIPGNMLPDSGDQIRYKPPCYAAKAKNRVELRVIADDPIRDTPEEVRAEAVHKKITDRSIDEVVDFQVQLFDRNDPIISARSARGSMAPASYRYGSELSQSSRYGQRGMFGQDGGGPGRGEDRGPGAAGVGAFGTAEEAEAYGEMLRDLVKYKKYPYIESGAPWVWMLPPIRKRLQSSRKKLLLFL